ncbi:hypothetical protein HDV01_001057 [Terramyces sp. JEL0728]|nr:hypothetical protein HDV01_001057 [Terramyces sp. JEL0728]
MKSCEACVKRKQRCTRTVPCNGCEVRNIPCNYQTKDDVQRKINNFEDRIKKLELQLIIPLKYEWKVGPNPVKETVARVVLSDELETLLFTDHDYLMDLKFEKFPSIMYYITEDYLRTSAKQFWPLRYSLYASGCLYATPDRIPCGLNNRIEMAYAYLEKALSYNYFLKPDPIQILTLTEIGSAYLRLDRKEGFTYLKLAVQLAKSIGMNNEVTLEKVTCFDYEQENLRRLWWLLYSIYCQATKRFCDEIIVDSDNMLYLPSDVFFKGETSSDSYGKEIMCSGEWFTPSVINQSLMGYRILLHRIELRIHKYILIELSNSGASAQYIFGSLCGSLRDWLESVRKTMCSHYYRIMDGKSTDEASSWLALNTLQLFNDNVMELIFPKFMKNILMGKKVENSMFFKQAVEAARQNAALLDLIRLHNPQMRHLNPYIAKITFKVAFFVQCLTKMPTVCTIQLQASYKLHIESLLAQSHVFQRTSNFYNILIYLQELDLYNSILTFGEFTARKFDMTIEKPNAGISLTSLILSK